MPRCPPVTEPPPARAGCEAARRCWDQPDVSGVSDGRAETGAAENSGGEGSLGNARLGSARLGSARLGSARLGSARLGSARLGSARLGSARLGSARLGSARLGSARLGSARLGSARLGSARLGSALIMGTTGPIRFCQVFFRVIHNFSPAAPTFGTPRRAPPQASGKQWGSIRTGHPATGTRPLGPVGPLQHARLPARAAARAPGVNRTV